MDCEAVHLRSRRIPEFFPNGSASTHSHRDIGFWREFLDRARYSVTGIGLLRQREARRFARWLTPLRMTIITRSVDNEFSSIADTSEVTHAPIRNLSPDHHAVLSRRKDLLQKARSQRRALLENPCCRNCCAWIYGRGNSAFRRGAPRCTEGVSRRGWSKEGHARRHESRVRLRDPRPHPVRSRAWTP